MAKPKNHANEAVAREQQERKDATEAAQHATAKRNQPHDVRQRALAQRQGKGMHQQDGK